MDSLVLCLALLVVYLGNAHGVMLPRSQCQKTQVAVLLVYLPLNLSQ